MTITSRDVTNQVTRSLDGREDDYDVDAIVADIIEAHGAVDIDTIDSDAYWATVAEHHTCGNPAEQQALAAECTAKHIAAMRLRDRLMAEAKPRTGWRRSAHAPAIKALNLAASTWARAATYYAGTDPVTRCQAPAEYEAAIEHQAKADALLAETPA
ncbi:hypothetical protein ACFRCG_40005 [Embleya sp. NPDC056575]|uniref:hypothetical protein n=1 Tax=unclassified Embleya TaxID=2699296 RepID=UPI0036B8C50E